jgi:hypothetical protein
MKVAPGNLPEHAAGQTVKCRRCGQTITFEPPFSSKKPLIIASILVGFLFTACLSAVGGFYLALELKRDLPGSEAIATASEAIVKAQESAGPPDGATPDIVGKSCVAIWQDYGTNAPKADREYKGKLIEFRGSGKVKVDPKGNYVFGVSASSFGSLPLRVPLQDKSPEIEREQKWSTEGVPPQVLCTIARDEQTKFAELGANDTAILVGRCLGRRQQDGVPQGYVVLFDECRLLEIIPFRR